MKTMAKALLFFVMSCLFCCPGCDKDVTESSYKPTGDTPATFDKRIERTNDFAFNLYHQLKSSDDNLILSPHSIVVCSGMAYAGARGNTEKQMAQVLSFNYPQQGFHTALKQVNDYLTGLQGLQLWIANGSWGRLDLTYLSSYLDTLSTCYGADIDYLDFVGDPEGSRSTINEWVRLHTAGHLTNLLPQGSIDAATYLVLANTVFFMAEWLHQFDPDYTWDGSFKRLDGSEVTVPIMNGEKEMPYYEGDGYRAMEMPYKGGATSMILIMPDEGNYQAFEDAFDRAVLDTVLSNLTVTYITFGIPKFGFHSGFDLIPTLQDMGMTDAFIPGIANFTGMDGVDDGIPWIDVVVHKAYIMIDEYGTMAFAGTGMVLSLGIHDRFEARRPFIFVIRDSSTGTILFMGRVLDPTQK